MHSSEQLSQFAPLPSEEAQYLRDELKTLREKDWALTLNAMNFEGNRLENATRIVDEFCKGIIDTVEDQLKRNLITAGYVLPRIAIVPSGGMASFNSNFNLIKIGRRALENVSDLDQEEDVVLRLDGGTILVRGNVLKQYYYAGNEEIKHSIDFYKGKMNLPENPSIGDFEYHDQIHEYLGLGEKVLRAKKLGDFAAFSSMKDFLIGVINFRREKRLAEKKN